MVVQHNLTAMNANRYFGINNKKLSKSLEKLSSGYSINRAGDNAAGLAVSEKMRSQIAGMTQAVKNAQDGISMVQTFEGALTETDSILQRMKTLANQMANGSYDDPVDRTAAQQEFYQLSDELDQIADTDFNGVVVLNGGVMADGTTAAGVTETKNEAGVTVRTLDKTAANAGLIDYRSAGKDISEEKAAEVVNVTSDKIKAYDGTDEDGNASTSAPNAQLGSLNSFNKGDYAGKVTEDVTVTYAYAGNGKWVNDYNDEVIEANEFGGFVGIFGETLSLDNSTLEVGEAVSVTVTAGIESEDTFVDTLDAKPTVDAGADAQLKVDDSKSGFTLLVDEGDMTTELSEKLKELNGEKVTITTAGENAGAYADGTNAEIAGDKIDIFTAGGRAGTDIEAGTVFGVYDSTSGKVTYYVAEEAIGRTDNLDETTLGKQTALAELQTGKLTSEDGDDGTVEYELYATSSSSTAGTDATITLETGVAAGADTDDLAEKINKAAAGTTDEGYEVSNSNAFSNSEAKMTYKDSIILQVGARTKDAVDFTFKYDSDAIGDLNADLDCSSKGLGINLLDLKTQENANYAIDKIDQAINKVSLVRGTFGAIQNRLEHKIDNLNVSVENLTSAESQIRDTNMAEEMMNFTKQQILSQASQSMLAQANQLPQSVLQLLQ